MGLDKEEQWYEDHADEFISSPAELRQKLISAAKTTMNKTERMNIRMSKIDMENLKTIANREGLPYQTLVTSIIHKYTAGQLVDLNEARKILQSS
ncbi:MAG: antitoxin [Spirochaetae bacterium HGW-Spirochaetae-7]|nr:MAG: antitoxin [Spirochaetae bacterium HGW-Spirochaetae-7]